MSTTSGTGAWTATNHGNESLRVPDRQNPNGRFTTNTKRATVNVRCTP